MKGRIVLQTGTTLIRFKYDNCWLVIGGTFGYKTPLKIATLTVWVAKPRGGAMQV
jgi:hypothetical protein